MRSSISARSFGLVACLLPGLAMADEIDVVVSVGPLAELVERIGGADVRLEVMLPSGAAPETWTPTPARALAVARADLFVATGHPGLAMEISIERIAEQAVKRPDGLERLSLAGLVGDVEPGSDPHLWMDLDVMRQAALAVASWLAGRRPEGERDYLERAGQYMREIDRLDRELDELLRDGGRRPLVLQHPAWQRLLTRYGVDSIVLEREGKEPSARTLAATVAEVGRLGIPVVFTQRGVSDRAARLLATEVGATVAVLDPTARDWLASLRAAGEAFARARG